MFASLVVYSGLWLWVFGVFYGVFKFGCHIRHLFIHSCFQGIDEVFVVLQSFFSALGARGYSLLGFYGLYPLLEIFDDIVLGG
jgi:hypothetical protein